MRVARCEVVPVSVPYLAREVSSQVERDGVTAAVVRLETDDGLVGWGESCSGADMASVVTAVHAMEPFFLGQDPWRRERIRRELQGHGLWQFREPTGNFAWAGVDMALWDLCGKAVGEPLHRLLGGAVREEVSYFWYLSGESAEDLLASCRLGVERGYGCFYLKVGRDERADVERVEAVRAAVGPAARLRIDANGAWTLRQAARVLAAMEGVGIDFVEQPVRQYPLELLGDLGRVVPVAVAANEGLWTEEQALDRILARVADVYCFSPYWVGSLTCFQRLGFLVERQGGLVCKHTHGELGLAAAAAHHAMLTLPAIVEGNQQTAAHMAGDVLAERLPIVDGPAWGLPEQPGLGVEVDPAALEEAAERYRRHGQFLPYQASSLAASKGW